MSKDITTFKEQVLEPALFNNEQNIRLAFPQLQFTKRGRNYVSKFHRNGGEATPPRYDKTYISEGKNGIYCDENGTIGAIGLTQLYMDLNGCDFITAINELAKIAGVEHLKPKYNKEAEEKRQKQLNEYKEAAKIMQKALFNGTATANNTLNFLHNRGWKDEEIKNEAAKLGHIDNEIKNELPASLIEELKYIDLNRYNLVIPIQVGTDIIGFKFRLTTPPNEGEPKYKNNQFLPKKYNLGGIPTTAHPSKGMLVIVEGELDAIHAKVKGLFCVASTLGGKVTPEQIEAAKNRGFKHLIFAYDADKAGEDYFKQTAKAAPDFGLTCYFVDLKDLGVKDIDEYLTTHSSGELTKYIDENSKHYVEFTTYQVINDYFQTYKVGEGNNLPAIARQNFINEIGEIILATAPADKILIYDLLELNKNWLRIEPKDIQANLKDKENEREQAALIAEQKGKAEALATALKDNKISEANNLIKELAANADNRAKQLEFIEALTPTPLATLAQGITDGIPTGYYFRDIYGNREELTLNAGLTFICAPTSHGKTSALNNIALNEAKRISGQNKCIIYFSYEVSKNRIVLDLINTEINDPELCNGLQYENKPITEIRRAVSTGNNFFTGEHNKNFARGLGTIENYWNTGTLKVIDTPYKVGELLKFIEYVINHSDQFGEVSMVLIDYIQLMQKAGKYSMRTEEIKEIVNDIKDFATLYNLPFVVAAQFNRNAISPASATLENIGEAGDIERIADTIISLINLDRFIGRSNIPDLQITESIKLLNEAGLNIKSITEESDRKEISNKVYLKILKRRYGRSFLSAVLNWNGLTKHIAKNNNFTPAAPQTKQLSLSDEWKNQFDNSNCKQTNNNIKIEKPFEGNNDNGELPF